MMRKLGLFCAFALFVGSVCAGRVGVETFSVGYVSPAITASTAAIIVDLSDSTNWPHVQTGEVSVSAIRVSVFQSAASTATIKIGVVTENDSSNGSATYFFVLNVDAAVAVLTNSVDYEPSQVRAYVNGSGETPYLLSNDTDSGSTVYQNDVPLPTAFGTDANTAAGDVVLFFQGDDAASTTVNVELLYTTER